MLAMICFPLTAPLTEGGREVNHPKKFFRSARVRGFEQGCGGIDEASASCTDLSQPRGKHLPDHIETGQWGLEKVVSSTPHLYSQTRHISAFIARYPEVRLSSATVLVSRWRRSGSRSATRSHVGG